MRKTKGLKAEEISFLIVLTFFFLIIRALQLRFFHYLVWDESVYVSMGKYLFSNGAIGLWEPFRPITWPVILGLAWFYKLDTIKTGVILQSIFGVLSLWLLFLLGKKLFNTKVAYGSTLVLAVCPLFFFYSNTLFAGLFSSFLMLLAVYLFFSRKYLVSGITAGLAFLSRFPQGLLFFGLLISLVTERKKNKKLLYIASFVTGFLLVLAPFLAFNFIEYKNKVGAVTALIYPFIEGIQHQNNVFETLAYKGINNKFYEGFFYFIELIKICYLFAFLPIGIILLVFENKKVHRILLLVLLLYLGYFTYIPNKQIRFAVSFLPLACLITGFGYFETYKRTTSLIGKWKIQTVVLWLIFLLLVSNSILKDKQLYYWHPISEPAIVKEFYKYFCNNSTKAKIITTDPVPSGYCDNSYIPVYFYPPFTRVFKELNSALSNRENKYLIFDLVAYPCFKSDLKCFKTRNKLIELVKKNQLVFNKTYNNKKYYIYLINHSANK